MTKDSAWLIAIILLLAACDESSQSCRVNDEVSASNAGQSGWCAWIEVQESSLTDLTALGALDRPVTLVIHDTNPVLASLRGLPAIQGDVFVASAPTLTGIQFAFSGWALLNSQFMTDVHATFVSPLSPQAEFCCTEPRLPTLELTNHGSLRSLTLECGDKPSCEAVVALNLGALESATVAPGLVLRSLSLSLPDAPPSLQLLQGFGAPAHIRFSGVQPQHREVLDQYAT